MMIRRLLAVAALSCVSLAWGQTVTPLVQPHQQFVGSSGSPCAGCSLYTYAAGTTTPQATYADASGLVPNTNPVVLDVTGSATIWLGPNPYKFQMKNPGGATLWTVDQIAGAVGYLPLHGGAMSGATTTWQMDGALSAYGLQTTPTSNNGIAMSLTQCASLPYACQILAPTLYALTEAQPFGGLNGDPQITGPKSSDPVGQFLDQRYGVPQWIFNGSRNYDSRHGTSPTFQMNWTGSPTLTGTFVHPAFALALGMNYWMGGHSFYNDKTNGALAQFEYQSWTEIQGGSGFARSATCYGVGDCLLDVSGVVDYGGASAAGDQGAQDQQVTVVTGNRVFGATVATVSAASDGTTAFSTSGQVENGTQGEGRLLLDMTTAYNAGYISQIAVTGGDTQVKCSGCNWDGTFGTSTKTTLTAAVQNPVSGTNSFPQSNTNLAVASSAGFVVGDVAGIYDYDYECEKVTAVPDGTHITLATDRKPHPVGSYVTRGGLACRAIEYEADRLSPSNTRGIATVFAYQPAETMRWAIPIMYSTAGNILYTFQSGNTLPGAGGGYTGAAYTQMGGSGGTCSVTVSGGAVTAVSVSGGTGYISATQPPQLVISGITYTTAPSVYVTGAGGALTSAAISSAGSGISGTPVCTVVTSNPYDIYDAAKTVQVYNEVTGKVDGSKLVTEPFPVTPTVSDTIEQPIYFWQHPSITSYNLGGTYLPTLGGASATIYGQNCVGILQGSDSCAGGGSQTNPALYAGYPATTNTVGYGQYLTPNFYPITGAWKQDFDIQMPPFGPGGGLGSTISGYYPGVFVVGCGSISCSKWTSPWFLSGFAGATQMNGWMANSSLDTLYGYFDFLDLSTTKHLNLGTPPLTTNAGLVSELAQNWNPYSNDLSQSTWSCDAGVTKTIDATVKDPFGGTQAVWKITTTNAAANQGCLDTVSTNWPGSGPISGNIWIMVQDTNDYCFNEANVSGYCTGGNGIPTGQWVQLHASGANAPLVATLGTYFYADHAATTYWIYNPVAEAKQSSASEMVNATATSVTTDVPVNQVGGKDLCTAGICASTGSATLVAGTVTVSTTAACTVSSTCTYQLTNCAVGGAQGMLAVGTKTAGVSFVINSSSATDTSTVCWSIIP